MTSRIERWLERGLLPDWLIRRGIRAQLRARLRDEHATDPEQSAERLQRWIEACDRSPIAVETAAANAQHYEVPAEFFVRILGPHLKYSSCYWPPGVETLAAAEEAVTLCCQSLRANYEALAHGVVARALLRRDGAAGCDRAQAALGTAADLVERTGAHLLAPALAEWRAELAGMRGDIAGRQHWLDAAARGFAAIKMVGA